MSPGASAPPAARVRQPAFRSFSTYLPPHGFRAFVAKMTYLPTPYTPPLSPMKTRKKICKKRDLPTNLPPPEAMPPSYLPRKRTKRGGRRGFLFISPGETRFSNLLRALSSPLQFGAHMYKS